MKKPYVLGSLLTIAAWGLAPAAALAADTPTGFDGVYAGSLALSASGLSTQNAYRSKCVEGRPATMTIRNGYVYIEYANWKGHKLHYRGTVDPGGAVNALHRNGDGTAANLTGRIANNVLSGNMKRDDC